MLAIEPGQKNSLSAQRAPQLTHFGHSVSDRAGNGLSNWKAQLPAHVGFARPRRGGNRVKPPGPTRRRGNRGASLRNAAATKIPDTLSRRLGDRQFVALRGAQPRRLVVQVIIVIGTPGASPSFRYSSIARMISFLILSTVTSLRRWIPTSSLTSLGCFG